MGDRHEDREHPDVRNDIRGSQVNGPVGQFGSVQGDVNLNWSQGQDSAELARAMEEAILRADDARRAARERERFHDQVSEGAALLGAAVLLFLFLWLVMDFWWWLSAGLTLVAVGKLVGERF